MHCGNDGPLHMPSVLWCCWLGHRKSIRPKETSASKPTGSLIYCHGDQCKWVGYHQKYLWVWKVSACSVRMLRIRMTGDWKSREQLNNQVYQENGCWFVLVCVWQFQVLTVRMAKLSPLCNKCKESEGECTRIISSVWPVVCLSCLYAEFRSNRQDTSSKLPKSKKKLSANIYKHESKLHLTTTDKISSNTQNYQLSLTTEITGRISS